MKITAALSLFFFAVVLHADDMPANCPMHAAHAKLLAAASDAAQPAASGHVEHQKRSLKALSDEQIDGYLQGHGMGLALPAELRHYPGPKHVLDAARELALTPKQSATVDDVFRRMDASARRLGAAYVAAERELDAFFERGGSDPARLRELTGRSGALLGELRAAHLAAHVETRAVLTREQIAGYDQLRGYGAAAGHASHPD